MQEQKEVAAKETEAPKRKRALVVPEAPMPFVLIGPVKGASGRMICYGPRFDPAVLGLARLPRHLTHEDSDSGRQHSKRVTGLYRDAPEISHLSITDFIFPNGPDARAEAITLAWESTSSDNDLNVVGDYFHNCAWPLYDAILNGTEHDAILELAPLLVLCGLAERRKPKGLLARLGLAR
jgi:hypothetical protein